MTKYSTIRKKIRYINNFELNAAIGNSTFHHKDLAINSLRNIYMLLAYIASSVLEEKIFTKEIKDFKCFEYNFFMMSNKIFYIYDILPLKTLEYSIDMELFEDKEGDRKVKEYLQRPKVQNFLIDFVRINPTILDYFKKYAVDQMYEILERLKGPAIIQNKRIFKNAGYKTFLVNEFRTSKLCNCCNEELENFLERPSQKPKLKKEGKTEICHGLLRCKSVKHKSEIFHNRDKNAVQNMLNIVKSVLNTGKRPEIFCREVNS